MAAKNQSSVTVVNMDPEEERYTTTSPTTPNPNPTAAALRESIRRNELWLPVTYHSVSAEVQNEIDRLSSRDYHEQQRQRRSSITYTQPLSAEEQTAIELINQLSIHRRQGRPFVRLNSAPAAEDRHDPQQQQKDDGQPSGSRFRVSPQPSPPSPKKRILDQVQSRMRISIRRDAPPVLDINKEATNDDHLVPLDVVEKRYESSFTRGLNEQQVTQRRLRDGPNILSPPKTTPAWLAFIKCLVGGFGVVLWVAFVMCILAYEPLGEPNPDIYNIILAVVILIVILAQAIFFFLQERRSSNLMASFANLLPTYCQVVRDGQVKNVEASDLVVGDIVRIRAGDKIPADMRVIEVSQAKVEKSSLTGESEPIPLSVTSADSNQYETRNLALFGCSLLEGSATGVVINTSDRTIMGKIARVASGTSSVSTSLQKEVNYFTGLVAVMAVGVCIVVVVGYYAGVAPSHPGYLSLPMVVTNCIAVVVSLLPEGTPVALAMILTLIAKRMYSVKILVKKLTVLETLGSATVIASDKTGTLTQNRMTLNHLWIVNDHKGGNATTVPNSEEDTGKKPGARKPVPLDEVERATTGCFSSKRIGRNLAEPALNYLCQVMCLCNKTVFESEENDNDEETEVDTPRFRRATPSRNSGPRKFVGNPTEGALLSAADEYVDTSLLRDSTPIVKEIAFSSRTKYHLTIHKVTDRQLFQNTAYAIRSTEGGGQPFGYVIYVKGAPEYVLGMCTRAVVNGDEMHMDAALVARIMKINELMGSNGERVLAFAYRKLSAKEYSDDHEFDMDDEEKWTSDLCFLGLAGIIDPPRDGVAASIDECHNAHIRVMMVTGDQPTTAVAIARAVNIITRKTVKTIADVQTAVPFSTDDDQLVAENRLIAAIKHWIRTPPKRKFKDESIVVAGNEIGTLSNRQWDYVLEHKEVVFARTTPQQKLQIVKESRKRGDVVAVTGDGVNDAPALKAADLGVAMGICGSDVSKEAANMVLLDDNFVTIVKGIKEGRLLFDNLKKVICYLFPNGSFSEILPVLAAVFLGMPMPLSTFLMIVICIGTDMVGSLGLIHEYAEADIMHRPPRDSRTDRLVNPRTILFAYFFVGIMESSIAFFMYFLTMYISGGVYPDHLIYAFNNWETTDWIPHLAPMDQRRLNHKGQTAFFVSLVMTQLWNLLAVRTRYQSIFRQKFQMKLLYFMLGEVAIVLCVVYLPVVQNLMYTQPLEYYHFLIPLGMGSVILFCDEIRKLLIRRNPKGILAKLAW